MNSNRLLPQFRISAAMQPYVLRIRLRGLDFDFGSDPEAAVAFTKCIGGMRQILLKRRISAIAADRAILKTLEAAIDFQLTDLRHRSLKTIEAYSYRTLDHLIRELRQLSHAIGQLPPTSKGILNRRASALIEQRPFDSDVFIQIFEKIIAVVPELAPRKLAGNILSLVKSEQTGDRRPPIIDRWESMPATTRVKIEELVQAVPSRSLARWLDNLADLLEQERPARKRGAPRSLAQAFVVRIATIWRSLGLKPGLAYDFSLYPATDDCIGRGGRVESAFQRYCRAALTAVGDATEISARQIANYKRQQKQYQERSSDRAR
jgi:hypothetical protein